MFENIFNKKEKPTDAEIIAGLEEKESSLVEKAVAFFEGLGGGEIKEKAASALLALSLFAGASSAFASEQGADSIVLPDMGEETTMQSLENLGVKNRVANFDWKKTVGKIELSVGSKTEDTASFKNESIEPWEYSSSEFFKDTTAEQINQAHYFIYHTITGSQNAEEFNTNLSVLSQKGETSLNDKQKMIAIQQFSSLLGYTYNYDMADSSTSVTVSDDAMFQAMKDRYYGRVSESGICTNIHVAVARYAQAMGIESFVQTGGTDRGPHAWMGMIVGEGEDREIVGNDYGVLLPTGTVNYKDALGVFERYHKDISLFNNYVGDDMKALFPVDSRASEAIKNAANIESPTDSLKRNLEQGEVSHEERGLYININPEVTSVKLNADTGIFSFTQLKGENNPYQSLQNMDALHAGLSVHNESLGVRGGITMVNMDIKGLDNEQATPNDAIIGTLALDALLKGESPESINKLGYGKMVAEMGAVFTEAAKMAIGNEGQYISDRLNDKDSEDKTLERNTELAFGTRLMYISPSDMSKVYFDASWEQAYRTNNFEDQEDYIKTIAQNIAVGAEVKVYEGTVVNMEVRKSTNEWGKGETLKIGVKGGTINANIDYTKKSSDFERFIPSSEKIKVGAEYQISPKWEVGIYGTKTTEQYKDAKNNETTAELKIKMKLW